MRRSSSRFAASVGASIHSVRSSSICWLVGQPNQAPAPLPRMEKDRFNLDFQTVDNATIVQRRSSKEPVGKGGWSLFIVGYAAAYMSPAESTSADRR